MSKIQYMQLFLSIPLLLLLWFYLPLVSAQTTIKTVECKIVRVTDGDTLKARCDVDRTAGLLTTTIRIRDIDAPEHDQPFGSESSESLRQLCLDQTAHVELYINDNEIEHDKYSRVLARVNCRGKNAGTHQIEQGMAWVYRTYLDEHSNATELLRLEAAAKRNQIGLWQNADSIAPWRWRRS
jgi:micrococcal nuclease